MSARSNHIQSASDSTAGPAAAGTDPAPLDARVRAALAGVRSLALLSGAGMSAESGLSTFRDRMTGLWERFDPSMLATPEAFHDDPPLVWGWYEWRRMQMLRAQPNAGHVAVAQIQRAMPLRIITQNVDDLHERGGGAEVLHLHGQIQKARCRDCGQPWSHGAAIPDEPEGGRRVDPPRCLACGGLVRPGVVWFGEALPRHAMAIAEAAVRGADALIVVGTSGLVYPAASLPDLALAAHRPVIVIDPSARQPWEGAIPIRDTAARALPAIAAFLRDRPPADEIPD